MSNIIDDSFFFGNISVAQASNSTVQSQLQTWIDDLEPTCLRLLFGEKLYDALFPFIVSYGSELITNGTFNTNAANWTLGSTWTFDNTKLKFLAVPPDGISSVYQLGILDLVEYYRVKFELTPFSTGYITCTFGNNKFKSTGGTKSFIGQWADVLGHGGIIVHFTPNDETFQCTLDNISVKQVIDKRLYDLLYGKIYTDSSGNEVNWKGLTFTEGNTKKSLIANYVYFYYYRHLATTSSRAGEKNDKKDNSEPTSPDFKLAKAWGEMMQMNLSLRKFLLDHQADYPEYVDPIKRVFHHSRLQPFERELLIKRQELFTIVNPLF